MIVDSIVGANGIVPPAVFITNAESAERQYREAFTRGAWQAPHLTLDELAGEMRTAATRRERYQQAFGRDCPKLRGRRQALEFAYYSATALHMDRIQLFEWFDAVEKWADSCLPVDGELAPPPAPWEVGR